LGLQEAELIERAAELGSDTAFFVRNTPQLCEGRGEVMTPIEIDIKGRWLVLIKPDESVSTREAYAGVRPAVPERRLAERVAEPIERWQGSVKNDFEESVFKAHPALARIKEELLESGAVYAAMSGSGSTIFGIFDSETMAKRWSEQTQYIYKM
jgi:4-diphosphocytidyl-2-C-methyl-D-erythritol kinase